MPSRLRAKLKLDSNRLLSFLPLRRRASFFLLPLFLFFCYNRQNGSHRKRLGIVICTNFTGTHAHQQMAHIHLCTHIYISIVLLAISYAVTRT